MKWSVLQLKAAGRKPIEFDEQISLENLKEDHPEIRDVSPFHIKGRVEYSRSLATFTFQIKGALVLPCSRTLIDVHFPIDLHVTEKFYPKQETHYFEEDDEIHFFEGNTIDLYPAIRERVLLEIPMQVYASKEQLDQALSSGEGWSFITEEDKKDQIDPRLADLAKFFDKKE